MYEIAIGGTAGSTWRTRGRTVALDTFRAMLWDNADCAFGVVDQRTNNYVGYLGLMAFDVSSGTASISAFFDERAPDPSVIAGDAILAFADYVFRRIGLRKLSIELPDGPNQVLGDALRRHAWVHHEGTLKAHAKLGQEYLDVLIFAVFASEYLDWSTRLHERCEPTKDSWDLLVDVLDEVLDLTSRDDLTGGHRLGVDLSIDSLSAVELIDQLEQRTGVALPLGELSVEVTLQQLVEVLDRARGTAAGAAVGS